MASNNSNNNIVAARTEEMSRYTVAVKQGRGYGVVEHFSRLRSARKFAADHKNAKIFKHVFRLAETTEVA